MYILEQAKEYIKNNRIKEAKIILKKMIEDGIYDKNIYLELGKCYLQTNKKKAIENIEKYIELGGEGIQIKVLLAKLYKDIGDIKKSRKILENENLNREGLIELFRINVIENQKDKGKKNITEIENRYGELLEIEEISNEYLKWAEYDALEELLKRNKSNLKEDKYQYYLYKIYKNENRLEDKIKKIRELKKFGIKYKKEVKEELIKESTENWYYDSDSILMIVDMLCSYIEEDDTDSDITGALSILLRKYAIKEEKKIKIIEILERYRKDSNQKRAGNIFLNEIEILEKKTVLKSRPRQLIVELTTKCNIRCLMCNVCLQNHSINSTILSFVKDNIPYLERIKWQGGEVFLYDKFDELVDLCVNNNVKQVIQTNGLLITKKMLKKLFSKNIHISFSIDSIIKDVYEDIRRGAKFENLMKVVNMFYNYKKIHKEFCYTLIMVVMSNNYKQIDSMIDFANKYGFQGVTFQKFMNYGRNDLLLNKEQKIEVINKIKDLRNKYVNGKISIQIHTSIPLEDNEYIEMNEDVEVKENNNCENFELKEENSFNVEIDRKTNNICLDKNSSLFCMVPWTELCISASNTLQFGAGSKSFRTAGYKYNEIWNCKDLVHYRQNLVNNNLSLCTQLCRNREDDSNRIKLGLIM